MESYLLSRWLRTSMALYSGKNGPSLLSKVSSSRKSDDDSSDDSGDVAGGENEEADVASSDSDGEDNDCDIGNSDGVSSALAATLMECGFEIGEVVETLHAKGSISDSKNNLIMTNLGISADASLNMEGEKSLSVNGKIDNIVTEGKVKQLHLETSLLLFFLNLQLQSSPYHLQLGHLWIMGLRSSLSPFVIPHMTHPLPCP